MPVEPRVWIAERALSTIALEAHHRVPLETGGLLFGYESTDHEVVITHALGPGPNALHGPEEFVPDYERDRGSAIAWWEDTEGAEYYLGDWHSHPDSGPYLSERDREVLELIAHDPGSQLSCSLMVVVGLKPDTAVAVWHFKDTDGALAEPEPCRIVRFEEDR